MKPKMWLIEFRKFIRAKICDYVESWQKKIRNHWLSWTKIPIYGENYGRMRLTIQYFLVSFPLASMEPWFEDFRFCVTWLDSSFRRSIFGSLLRAKDFYSRDYQESLKSLRRNRLRFLQGSVVGVPGSSAGSMSDVNLARFCNIGLGMVWIKIKNISNGK